MNTSLMDLGLTPQESTAYKTALGLGTFAASSLGNILKIPRSTARYTCEALVRKGLMIETKKANTKLFIAENPTKLYSLLYNEEEELKKKKDHLALTIKELQQQYDPDAKIPKITFYDGMDGVEKMLEKFLNTSSKMYSFGAGDYFINLQPQLVDRYRKKAIKLVPELYIFRSSKYSDIHQNDPKYYQTKYFKTIDELKVDFQIIEDTVSIVSMDKDRSTGILIQHKEIAEAISQIFQELWNKSE